MMLRLLSLAAVTAAAPAKKMNVLFLVVVREARARGHVAYSAAPGYWAVTTVNPQSWYCYWNPVAARKDL